MCTFATQGNFATIIASFASASAGLIQPRPGQVHFNLNARTCATPQVFPADARQPVGGDSPASTADRRPYSLDACFDMVTPVDLPERIVEVRK